MNTTINLWTGLPSSRGLAAGAPPTESEPQVMSKLLFVSSSILGENSKSRTLGLDFIETWTRRHPGTAVAERDLVAETLPNVTGAVLGAALTPPEKRSPEQA